MINHRRHFNQKGVPKLAYPTKEAALESARKRPIELTAYECNHKILQYPGETHWHLKKHRWYTAESNGWHYDLQSENWHNSKANVVKREILLEIELGLRVCSHLEPVSTPAKERWIRFNKIIKTIYKF